MAAPALRGLPFGIAANDAVTYVAVAVLLFAIAMLAAILPALARNPRRAVDCSEARRVE
jgi:hypothetical protein